MKEHLLLFIQPIVAFFFFFLLADDPVPSIHRTYRLTEFSFPYALPPGWSSGQGGRKERDIAQVYGIGRQREGETWINT